MKAVDLFAGAGGFDLGAAELGLHPLGVEIDATVCETRAKAGLETLHADVAALDPADFAGCELLLASPPCPTWSAAGRGAGHQIADIVLACAAALAAGRDERETARAQAYEGLLPDAVADERHRAARQRRAARLEAAEARARREATLSLLLVEPLRFALALRPAYIACEQVPPVLPAWQAFAHLLNARGYSTWAGILNAADFGVPQTRQRAFLLASLDGPALPPEPTHCRGGGSTVFGELKPWVSMADALGWGMTERPSVTVAAGSSRQGGHDPLDGGSGSRTVLERERERILASAFGGAAG